MIPFNYNKIFIFHNIKVFNINNIHRFYNKISLVRISSKLVVNCIPDAGRNQHAKVRSPRIRQEVLRPVKARSPQVSPKIAEQKPNIPNP